MTTYLAYVQRLQLKGKQERKIVKEGMEHVCTGKKQIICQKFKMVIKLRPHTDVIYNFDIM